MWLPEAAGDASVGRKCLGSHVPEYLQDSNAWLAQPCVDLLLQTLQVGFDSFEQFDLLHERKGRLLLPLCAS